MDSTTALPTELQPYKRYELNQVDQLLIAMKVQQAQMMKNVPAMMKKAAQVVAASKFLLETKGLVEKVVELRKERGYQFLDEDKDFSERWKEIESAAYSNNALLCLRLALAENIKLVHEINQHLSALDRPLMKTYK